jgi:cytochrome c oxidase subunit II
MLVMGGVATVIGIVIVLLIPWFPTTASKQAGNVKTLFDVLLIVSVPIAVLVITVVLYSVWKFHMKPGEELKDGPPIHGNTRLEVVWTAVPAVLIISLVTYAYAVLHSNEAVKANAMVVNVTERQFAFEFSYRRADGQTIVSPVLYMAENQPVVFKLRSLDVIHSFFVPSFSEKLDAVPGITTTLRVTATRLGTYPVECTELCGAGHALMRSAVHVVSPTAMQAWLQAQPTTTPPPVGIPPANAAEPGEPGAGASAAAGASSGSSASTGSSSSSGASSSGSLSASATAGKAVFTGAAGCGTCHTLAAAGTTGTTGPNLGTAIVGDAKKAGMPLKAFIQESILKPNAYISPGYPASVMPQSFAQTLTPAQIQNLVAFIAGATK